jgi:hypothetical protein
MGRVVELCGTTLLLAEWLPFVLVGVAALEERVAFALTEVVVE